MTDRGLTGCDWIKIPNEGAVRFQPGRHLVDYEKGGYCARRAIAEHRVCNARAAASNSAWKDDAREGSLEERACGDVWADCGDPFGDVWEGTGGWCNLPWEADDDEEEEDGDDRHKRKYKKKRAATPRLPKVSSNQSRCSLEADVPAAAVLPMGTEGKWAKVRFFSSHPCVRFDVCKSTRLDAS
jgi:hypothetical protein